MIRKACIAVLLLGAVATAVRWVGSYLKRSSTIRIVGGNVDERGWAVTGIRGDPAVDTRVIGFRGDLIVMRFPSHGPIGKPSHEWKVGTYGVTVWAPPRYAFGPPSTGALAVKVPFCLLFAVLAAYPSIAFIRGPVRRWRRQRKGLCRMCGYDLTGNASRRCPECGEAV